MLEVVGVGLLTGAIFLVIDTFALEPMRREIRRLRYEINKLKSP